MPEGMGVGATLGLPVPRPVGRSIVGSVMGILNGDAPIYDLRLSPVGSTSWLLFLEGGGWCYGATQAATIASCAQRAGFLPPDGDAPPLADEAPPDRARAGTPDYGGVLSADCSINPTFCEWNHAFLHYRDGSSFGSNRPDPIDVRFGNGTRGAKMWLRGRPSFDAVIDDLRTRHGMDEGTEIILSGGSAGGLAVLSQELPHALARVMAHATRLNARLALRKCDRPRRRQSIAC